MLGILPFVVAGIISGLMTFFDHDQAFHLPEFGYPGRRVFFWLVGFALFNAGLALIGHLLMLNLTEYQALHPLIQGLIAGVSYPLVMRSKWKLGKDFEVGPEDLNKAIKRFLFTGSNLKHNISYSPRLSLNCVVQPYSHSINQG